MKEGKKNVKNTGSESFLFSLFQRLAGAKEDGQESAQETVPARKEETDIPEQDPAAGSLAGYDTQDIFDAPADSPLLSYRMRWKGGGQPDEDASMHSFVYDEQGFPPEEAMKWMNTASDLAKGLLEERDRRMDADCTDDSLDARLLLVTARDGMSAWCFVFPALKKGKGLSAEDISAELEGKGITSGILEDCVKMAVKKDSGLKWIKVAEGIPPQHGTDGTLTENYSHSAGVPQFLEDEKGNVDFHELNWLVKIHKGDEICRFTRAVKGRDGRNVFGREVKAKNGREAKLPAGRNTEIDQEGCRVISKADGQLSYRGGRFHVSELLEIHGDVATATGNIDAQCDVLIHGSIRSGYTVRALGSIVVNGMVERSTVIAGKDVYIAYGMAGGSTGTIDAGGTVRCRYLENANVRVTGDVIAESIVNSQVSSDGSIYVNIGRGAIVGGRLLAMDRIEAKVIGNKVHGHTVLTIGPSPHFQEIKMQLGIEYANASGKGGQQDGKKDKREQLKKLLEELEEKENLTKKGQVLAGTIYPVTEVSFQGLSRMIETEENLVRLFRDSDGIRTGRK